MSGVQRISGEPVEAEADIVILGTGYQPRLPSFLDGVDEEIHRDEKGRFVINKGYDLETELETSGNIYVQNAELHTHGVGAPDLGLGAYRNAVIINSITERQVYATDMNQIFQTFGAGKKRAVQHL